MLFYNILNILQAQGHSTSPTKWSDYGNLFLICLSVYISNSLMLSGIYYSHIISILNYFDNYF